MMPVRCVVDTNVAVTANGGNAAASQECEAASARVLEQVMARGHLFIDAAGWIVEEYRKICTLWTTATRQHISEVAARLTSGTGHESPVSR